eukprot:1359728-Alexandrium_andersonii.AAC.1
MQPVAAQEQHDEDTGAPLWSQYGGALQTIPINSTQQPSNLQLRSVRRRAAPSHKSTSLNNQASQGNPAGVR